MLIEETIEVEEKDQGFTLVELLIVIVILGILATIVVFAVRGITDSGQKSTCKATAKTYEVAIEAYYAQYGTAGGHPAGTDLVTAGLLRSYNATDVVITPASPTSTVTAAPAGKCTTTSL